MSLLGTLADKEINDFLRTVTIKNAYFATRSRNRQLRVNSNLVPENIIPYYKHIAGEYILRNPVVCQVKNPKTGLYETQTYDNTCLVIDGQGYQNRTVKNADLYDASAFDDMMYVTSLDTGEDIPFTLENLHPEFASDASAVHTKTLAVYKIPSRFYDLLCKKYPAQTDLIKAIVYPVKCVRGITDIELNEFETNGNPLPNYRRRRRDAMVAAGDYTLLSCDETILEELERHDLITHAKMILRNLDKRWNIEEFWKEQNYPLVLWAIVWCSLRLGLIIRRYENIKTQFAHSSHVWDYLESKGLEPYRGYLTTAQTKFLYKNIEYILRNRGKQKVTNILVDEFLTDIGLNLKAKTIVLDTSETLDASKLHHISEIKTQCLSCSRRSYCHKNIKNFECPNYLNISGLCEASPIVLTEEFIGARKSKIISALVNQYGYTESEAKTKYERSIIWKDEEIEAIRSDYDRDQLTDVNGPIESLDTLIQREHASGLEPEYSERVISEQTKDLQHISGTVAPTKLIELMRNRPQPKYQSLFNKFLTETLLHLAPRLYTYKNQEGGTTTDLLTKVSTVYNISFSNISMNCTLSYGELLAFMYLGVVREGLIDLFFDHCSNDDAYGDQRQYFRFGYSEDDDELKSLVNASRLIPLTKGGYVIGTIVSGEIYTRSGDNYVPCTDVVYLEGHQYYKKESPGVFTLLEPGDYVPNEPINDDHVYQWAPFKSNITGKIDFAAGHDPLTDFQKLWSYNFPIPYQARIKNTFKFGKPVPQQALVDAWYSDIESDFDYRDFIPQELLDKYEDDIKTVTVNDIVYVVSPIDPASSEMWEGWSVALQIHGIIKNKAYFPARDEVAIIPKYARWYSEHLTPTNDSQVTKATEVLYIEDGVLPIDEKDAAESTDTKSYQIKFDANKGKRYVELEIEQYFDLDAFLSGYVDLTENVTTQEQIGEYLTKMFSLLERTYAYAEGCPSTETQIVARTVLDACLVNKQDYRFDLTGTNRTSKWIPEDTSRYVIEHDPISVALYSDWLKRTDNLKTICDAIDASSNTDDIWKEFNSDSIRKVLEFCTSPYVETSKEVELAQKMRKLVASLSSYKITFIDGDEEERYTDSTVAVTHGDASKTLTIETKEYVSPIMDSVCNPHIACYETTEDGYIMMRTPDTHALGNKMYYEVVNEQYVDPDLEEDLIEIGENMDVDMVDTLNLDVISYKGVTFEDGTLLTPNTYYEKIDIRKILGVSTVSSVVEFRRENGKWKCRVGAEVSAQKEVVTYPTDSDMRKRGSQDEFISSLKVDQAQKKKLVTYKYRKTIQVNDYGWTAWMDVPLTLDSYMGIFAMARTIYVHDKTNVDVIIETGDSIVDDKWNLDFGYTDDGGTVWPDIHREFNER